MEQQILELRQYTHHPGSRDTLVDLFERIFLEHQERVGISVVGHFRQLDDPDRFIWLRGFPTMEARAQALRAFYEGPIWLANRDAANATLVDSDDVLLLRPTRDDSTFVLEDSRAELYVATVYLFEGCAETRFVQAFERDFTPVLERAGVRVRASFVSEHEPNGYPRLPVREDDHAFVWFASYADLDTYRDVHARLDADDTWRTALTALAPYLRDTELRRLVPADRSRLR